MIHNELLSALLHEELPRHYLDKRIAENALYFPYNTFEILAAYHDDKLFIERDDSGVKLINGDGRYCYSLFSGINGPIEKYYGGTNPWVKRYPFHHKDLIFEAKSLLLDAYLPDVFKIQIPYSLRCKFRYEIAKIRDVNRSERHAVFRIGFDEQPTLFKSVSLDSFNFALALSDRTKKALMK